MYFTEKKKENDTETAAAQGLQLTEEQAHFINMALKGYNVLTNACIGSGKTTAIQSLCSRIPPDKNVLYLTYNTLLKADARAKIPQESTRIITNYHGFAALILRNNRQKMTGKAELIQRFNELQPELPHIDVLIIDEYQDIDEEISEMLLHIRRCNPEMQIVAVGDMNQRINNRTSLDIGNFIYRFLHNGRTFYEMSFTKCFRLSPKYAAQLGEIWGTTIRGTNRNCRVMRMTTKETAALLAEEDPKNVIVLGPNSQTPKLLNHLEKYYPEKYNKHTVYASIREEDAGVKQIAGRDCAVFTTYDGSKGLERKTCIIMDFTKDNWDYRLQKGNVTYEILRNIFLVAISRGKERIIFVDDGKKEMLKKETLMMRFGNMLSDSDQHDVSCMFDYKYQEDVEECYRMLDIRTVRTGDKKIEIKQNDGFIDLSPCIGNFQEADYFHYYNIDDVISHHEDIVRKEGKKHTLPPGPTALVMTTIQARHFLMFSHLKKLTGIHIKKVSSLIKMKSKTLLPKTKLLRISGRF